MRKYVVGSQAPAYVILGLASGLKFHFEVRIGVVRHYWTVTYHRGISSWLTTRQGRSVRERHGKRERMLTCTILSSSGRKIPVRYLSLLPNSFDEICDLATITTSP